MAENVVKLKPVSLGASSRLDPNEILDGAKEEGFSTVIVIGEMEDGAVGIASNANMGVTLILLERAKYTMLFDEDD
jgi:5-formaminoimidazole-4-carboxamide-1-beta-D-ribofuranosyl 5'-monophosphate synthetase